MSLGYSYFFFSSPDFFFFLRFHFRHSIFPLILHMAYWSLYVCDCFISEISLFLLEIMDRECHAEFLRRDESWARTGYIGWELFGVYTDKVEEFRDAGGSFILYI